MKIGEYCPEQYIILSYCTSLRVQYDIFTTYPYWYRYKGEVIVIYQHFTDQYLEQLGRFRHRGKQKIWQVRQNTCVWDNLCQFHSVHISDMILCRRILIVVRPIENQRRNILLTPFLQVRINNRPFSFTLQN